MKDNFLPEQLDLNDVVEHEDNTYKISKILSNLEEACTEEIGRVISDNLTQKNIVIYPSFCSDKKQTQWNAWFDRGIDCELLRVGNNSWQKGKIRLKVSLEFIPDNVSSHSNGKMTDNFEEDIWASEINKMN